MKSAIALILGIAATSFCVASQAHDFCVTSISDLRAALAATSDGGAYADEPNGIFIATGTYFTSDTGARLLYMNTSATTSLHLWGGYSADCTQRTDDASQTILDGDGATQVLVARSSSGYVDILNFTLQGAETNQPGAGLSINDTGSTSGDVLVRNMIIRHNHTSSIAGGFRAFARGDHAVYFDNNLVDDNSADAGYGAGELFGESQVFARYDTVTRNTTTSTNIGGVICGGVPTCEIANDVFWQNANTDLYLFTDATMYFTDIGVLAGTVPSVNTGALNGDPVFVDAAGGNFHLGNGSPLIGVSTYLDSDSDNDIEGHPLPLTGRTDIGAYLETIFSDGYESP